MAIVKIVNVAKIFRGNALPVPALKSVSLEISEGEFVVLSGPSGSGKTTLLNLMGCLDRPEEGEIYLDGENVTHLPQQKLTPFRLHKIGFIFQDYNLIPTLSAQENIEYALWLQGVNRQERRARSVEVAEKFSIAHLLGRRPAQLSRGQQQRVAVARAIVHRPRLVLGDELTANLDQKTGAELMDFLRELNQREKITFVYATHDPVMIERANRVVRMQDGEIISDNVVCTSR